MRSGRESLVVEKMNSFVRSALCDEGFLLKKPLGFKTPPSGSFFTLLSQELSIVRRLLDIPFNQQ
ncbi:hypothetical protein KZ779_26765 [Escherichia coli]|nr:hypothetical protein [Escherichia coli]